MRQRWNVMVLALAAMIAGGLVMPALSWVREVYRRNQGHCRYKQIGLGLHGYHDAHGTLPPGTVPNPALRPEQRLSWLVELLPFIEQAKLHDSLDRTKGWEAPENQQAVHTRVETYLCPANPNQPVEGSPGLTHYVGITGVGLDAATLPATSPRAGLFGYDRKITLEDITDGRSSTLWGIGTACMNGPWAAGGPASVRAVIPSLQPYIGPNRPFGGVHQGRVRIGLADGSVGTLSESVSPAVMEALATIAEGKPAPDY